MKIALLEPLRVPEARINELAQPLIDAGHEFTYYPDKTTDPNELYERSKDADIVMIANNPYPVRIKESPSPMLQDMQQQRWLNWL